MDIMMHKIYLVSALSVGTNHTHDIHSQSVGLVDKDLKTCFGAHNSGVKDHREMSIRERTVDCLVYIFLLTMSRLRTFVLRSSR